MGRGLSDPAEIEDYLARERALADTPSFGVPTWLCRQLKFSPPIVACLPAPARAEIFARAYEMCVGRPDPTLSYAPGVLRANHGQVFDEYIGPFAAEYAEASVTAKAVAWEARQAPLLLLHAAELADTFVAGQLAAGQLAPVLKQREAERLRFKTEVCSNLTELTRAVGFLTGYVFDYLHPALSGGPGRPDTGESAWCEGHAAGMEAFRARAERGGYTFTPCYDLTAMHFAVMGYTDRLGGCTGGDDASRALTAELQAELDRAYGPEPGGK